MVAEARLLLSCLRREEEAAKLNRLQDYTVKDWELVLEAALQSGLAPILFRTLKALDAELDIDGEVWEKLRSVYYLSAARNMRLYHELLNILSALNSRGIAVIILKGAHLAESVYGNIALRPMGDVDLLARSEDLSRVDQVLIEEGYSSADGMVSCQLHLAPYNTKNGLNIDVHFSITRPPVARRFDVAALWDRAKKDSYQGVDVLTLSPEDLILHLSTHTCIDHGFNNGLIPFFDLLHTVEHYKGDLNWERLWDRGTEWGIERSVYLMLALTEKMLGLPMPQEIKKK